MAIVLGGHETGLLDGSLTILNRADRTRNTDPGGGEQIYVNVANGNLTVQNRDVFMPSLGQDFELIRTYNSRFVPDDQVRLPDDRWLRTYNVFIMEKDVGGQKSYEVTYSDGSTFLFQKESEGDVYRSIDGDGAFEEMVVLAQGGGDEEPFYEVTRADQSRLVFSKHGRLLKWVDTNGVKTEFSYNAQLHLSQVRDDRGHVIDYTYQNSRISQVDHNEHGILVNYTYNSDGQLSTVTDRNGHATSYFYEEGRLVRLELPYQQTVDEKLITYEKRIYEFDYEPSGSDYLLTRITLLGADTVEDTYTSFEYQYVGNTQAGTTRMVDPLGNARACSNEEEYVQWRESNGYYGEYQASLVSSGAIYESQFNEIRCAHSILYAFDEDSYITEVTDQQGYKTEYKYDDENNVFATIDNNGWGATHSDSNYFRDLRAELGYADGLGNGKLVVELNDIEKAAIIEAFTNHYEYDDRGNLARQIDNADNVTTWTYTSFNKVETTTSAVGHALSNSEDKYYQDKRIELGYAALAADLTDAEKLALQELYTTYFEYDEGQNIVERRDPGGDITRFEYDAWGNNTRRIVYMDSSDLNDPSKQQITLYEYDQFGNVVAVTDAEGNRTKSEYDLFGNLTRFIDAKGGETKYVYDGDDRLISTTSAMGNTTLFSYDAVGNRIAITNADDHTVTSVYDLNNNLIATLEPSTVSPGRNRSTQYGYDVVGNRTFTVDAQGRRTDYEFNTRRQLVKTISAQVAGEDGVTQVRYQSSTGYDGVGNRIYTTDNRGSTTEFFYTQNHLVKRHKNADGHITETTYDANSNQIMVVAGMQLAESLRQAVRFGFDEENQVIYEFDAEGNRSSQSYDAVGNRVSFTDGNGHTTDYEFDRNNRLVREIHPEVIDPRTGYPARYVAETRYDGNGNVVEEIDENNNSTKYIFDRDNRLVVTEDANGTQTIFEYDPRNNRTQVIIDGEASVEQVTVPESFKKEISYEGFEKGWGDYRRNVVNEPEPPLYDDKAYAFEGSKAAFIGGNSGNESSFRSANQYDFTSYEELTVDFAFRAEHLTTGESFFVELWDGSRWNVIREYINGDNRDFKNSVFYQESLSIDSSQFNFTDKMEFRFRANTLEGSRRVYIDQIEINGSGTTLRTYETIVVEPPKDESVIQRYEYNEFNELVAYTDGMGNALLESNGELYQEKRQELGYERDFNHLSIEDRHQLKALYTATQDYDRVGNLVESKDNEGRVTRFEYDALNRQTKVISPTDDVTTSGETETRYDGNGNQVEFIDANGHSTKYIYDAMNRHRVTVNALEESNTDNYFDTDITFYDSFSNAVATINSFGTEDQRVTRYEYDLNNRLTRIVKPEQNDTCYEYDAVGNRVRIVDGRKNSTEYKYDAMNRKVRVIDPLLFETRFEYDGVGNTLAIVDARNGIRSIKYDALNRQFSLTDAKNRVTTFAYDARSNRTEIRTAKGVHGQEEVTLFEYDAENNLRRVFDAMNSVTVNDFDRVYNQTSVIDANNNETRTEYDALNRKIKIIDALNGETTIEYDAVGNRLSLTDALNNKTEYRYDELSRIYEEEDARGIVTQYQYDYANNNVSIIRAANTADAAKTVFEYDLNDRLVLQRDAEGNTTTYQYDENDNRTTVTDARGHDTVYVYDERNLVTEIHDAEGYVTYFECDGNQNRVRVTDARNNDSFSYYNENNELKISVDAEGYATVYEYDYNGNLIRETLHMQALLVPLDSTQQPNPVTSSNDQVTSYEYDLLNRITARIDAEGYRQEFTYDAVGNRLTDTQYRDLSGTDVATVHHFYDELYRETESVTAEGYLIVKTYDDVGNMLTETLYDDPVTLPSSGEAPAPATGDPGRITEFEYDRVYRLQRSISPLLTYTDYEYDERGNIKAEIKAAETKGAQRTEFIYDFADRLVETVDAEGTRTRRVLDGNGNIEILYEAYGSIDQRATRFVYDRNNRQTQMIDAHNTITQTDYDASGNVKQIHRALGLSEVQVETFEYDKNNREVARENGERERMEYEYDGAGNITLERTGIDSNMPTRNDIRETIYTYDKDNRLASLQNAEGIVTEYSYDGVGNNTKKIEAKGINGEERIHVMVYDLDNRMISQQDPLHGAMSYTYDALGNITSLIDANNHTTSNIYDGIGRLLETKSHEGVVSAYTYDRRDNRRTVSTYQIDSFGAIKDKRTTICHYDILDRLVRKDDPESFSSVMTYDVFGNRLTEEHGLYLVPELDPGDIPNPNYDPGKAALASVTEATTYGYDILDRLETVVDSAGLEIEYGYDAHGNRRSEIVDGSGSGLVRKTSYQYDKANRVLVKYTPESGSISSLYNVHGELESTEQKQSVDLGGNAYWIHTRYEYDVMGRIAAVVDGENNRTEYEYDAVGNQTVTHFGVGTYAEHSTEIKYDLNNRVVSRIDGMNNQVDYTYDSVGNQLTVRDAKGNEAFYYYDGDNRKIASVNEEGYLQQIGYDSLGNVVRQENFSERVASEVTTDIIPTASVTVKDRLSEYFFDGNGRMIRKIDASAAETTYLLDSRGNLLVETDNLGRQVHYVYDRENRVTSIRTADNMLTEYVYDLFGNNTKIITAVGTADESVEVLEYDLANRLVSKKQYLDLNLLGENYLETRFRYDCVGNMIAETDANNNTSTWEYDFNNREVLASDPYFESIVTQYDAVGNVVKTTDSMGGVTTNYFDNNKRIILSVDAEGWVKSFSYDKNNNLIAERLHLTAPIVGIPDPVQVPTLIYSSLDQVTSYEYDALNRKVAQVDGEGYRMEIQLDAYGNRLSVKQQVTEDGSRWSETLRYYDSSDRITYEVSPEGYLSFNVYDGVGNLIEKNLYKEKVIIPSDSGEPVRPTTGEIKFEYVYDAVNRLTHELSPLQDDSFANITTYYEYDQRGNRTLITKAYGTVDAVSTSFNFDKANRLTDTLYAQGSDESCVTHLELDKNGNIEKEYLAYGTEDERITAYEYDKNNRVVYKTLALGTADLEVKTYFELDANGNLLARHEGYGTSDVRIVEFEYDKNNQATAEIKVVVDHDDPNTIRRERAEISYDGTGNQVLKVVAAGTEYQRISRYEYDLDNRLVTEIVGLAEGPENVYTGGTRTEYIYDGLDNKIETLQAVGVQGKERRSFYEYDLEGRVVRITDPENAVTEYEYDVHGNQTVITDANNNIRRNYFDALGRLQRSEFGGVLVTNEYDYRGNTVKATQSRMDGSELRETYYGYDLLDQQVWIVDAEGFASILAYDRVGNQTRVTTGLYIPELNGAANDPVKAEQALNRAATTEFQFDKLNRQIRMVSASGSGDENVRAFTYDRVGNKTGEIEAFGSARQNAVTHEYDTANRLIQTTNPEGGITRFRYNEAGETILQQMLQQDGSDLDDTSGPIWIEHRFDYDDYGCMVFKYENPDALDASERLTTHYQYDVMGNLEKTTAGYGLGVDVQRITQKLYDLNNRVVKDIDAEGNESNYTYDAMGNRTSVTDGRGITAYYYFDAHGNTSKILDGNRYLSEYVYDSANNRIEERVYATRYAGAVPPDGTPTVTKDSANDRISSSQYNDNNWLVYRLEADGSEHAFYHDAAGNVVREERYVNSYAPQVLRYGYDRLNRVVHFTDLDGSVTETRYDASNNKIWSATIASTGLDPVALNALGLTGYGTTRTTITSYEYDLNNRLITEVFDPEGLNIEQRIRYDEMGNAVCKTNGNGVSEEFSYNRLNNITSQSDGLGNITHFGMDVFGGQVSVQNPRLHTATFVYDRNGRVTLETQPEVSLFTMDNGFVESAPETSHIYDAVGNEIQTIDANGNKTTRYYDGNNQLVAEFTQMGGGAGTVLREWTYNAFGDTTTEKLYMEYLPNSVHNDYTLRPSAPSGDYQLVEYRYDKAGRLTETINPDVQHVAGNLDLLGADVDGQTANLILQHGDLRESREYDIYGQLKKIIDRRGSESLCYYDAKGQLLAQIDSENFVKVFVYDGQGNVTKQSVFLEATTGDYTIGQAPSLTDLMSYLDGKAAQEVIRVYDAASRVVYEIAPEIAIFESSKYSDNELRALASINTENEQVITAFTYDSVGNETSRTLASGSSRASTEYSFYDAANRRIALIEGNRVLSTFSYDENGNRTQIARFFNAIDNEIDLLSLYQNSNYTTADDFAALVSRHVNDQVIQHTFNELNQEVSRTELMNRADANDDLTERSFYDGMNQKTWSQATLTSSEYATNNSAYVTQFAYNSRGDVIRMRTADGTLKHSEYDTAGNLIKAYTGSVPAPSEAQIGDINLSTDGIEINWTMSEPSGVQTYLVFGSDPSTNIGVPSGQFPNLGYTSSSGPLGNLSQGASSAIIDKSQFSGGEVIYFRVVAQTSSGSLCWSEEQRVTMPPEMEALRIVQSEQGALSLIAGFSGSVNSPVLLLGGTTVSGVSLGDDRYEYPIVEESLQDATFKLEWQIGSETYTSGEFGFEALGVYHGVSTSLHENTLLIGEETKYRVAARTVVNEDQELQALTVHWTNANGEISGTLSPTVTIDGNTYSYSYEIGKDVALENEEYTITLRGLLADGSVSLLDQFRVTPGAETPFQLTRDRLSIPAAQPSNPQVFINGERVNSEYTGSTENRVLIAVDNLGTSNSYSTLYGNHYRNNHTVEVSTPDADTVNVTVEFSDEEIAEISDALRIAYKNAGSEMLYSQVSELAAVEGTNLYSMDITDLGASNHDFKIYYYNTEGQEVVVELFRFAHDDVSKSISAQSITLSTAEYDGSINVINAPGGNFLETKRLNINPGLYVGDVQGLDVRTSGSVYCEATDNPGGSFEGGDGTTVGYFTINTYNALNVRVGTNEQNGNWKEFAIDANGNVVRTRDYGESSYVGGEIQYSANSPLESFTTYDKRNRVSAEYSPLSYMNGGVLVKERGTLKTYTYNNFDKVVRESNVIAYVPGGSDRETVTEREYDLVGNLIRETQALGAPEQQTKRWYYDRRGNETAVVSENSLLGGSGNLSLIDHLHIKSYDLLSNIEREVGAEADLKKLQYDAFSRVTRQAVSSAQGLDYVYDHRNRLVSQTDAMGYTTTFRYDGRDNKVATVDANGFPVEQTWDPVGNALTKTSYLNYDRRDAVTTRKDFDAYGNTVAEYDEEGRVRQSIYGAFSQLSQAIDQGGRKTSYEYDRWGRLISETGDSGKNIERKYDSLGRLLEINDISTGVKTNYTYDIAGRKLTEVIRQSNSVVRNVSYSYDAHGQTTRWHDSTTGAHLNYTWYKNGNLYRAFTDAGWDPTESNSDPSYRYIDHVYYYDKNNRVTSITQKGNRWRVFEYNEAGNRKFAAEIVDKDDPGYSSSGVVDHSYTYYANGRVETAAWSSGGKNYKATWTYDKAGNVENYVVRNETDDEIVQQNLTEYTDNYRVKKTTNKSRNDDNELVTQLTTKSLDKSGRVVKSALDDGENTFIYNYTYFNDGREHKVVASGKADGSSETFYDVNDNITRINKGTADGADGPEYLRFKYNNEGQILHRFHEQGDNELTNTNTEYLYANGNPVGEMGNDEDNNKVAKLDTGRYNLVQKVDDSFPSPTVSSYTVRRGDTLQSIASTLYGNASLWFVLADANGLNATSVLKEGTHLTVPGSVKTGNITSSSHVLYDQNEIAGSSLPNLKGPKQNGCVQVLVIVLTVIVAVVAAVLTAGIGGAIVASAGAGLSATIGAIALAGLVGAGIAAAANVLTQGINIWFGVQKEFSWSSLAFAAAAGFLSGVAGGVGAAANAAAAGSKMVSFAKVALPLLRMGSAAIKQLGADSDGDGKADWKITSWVGLAAAGAGGYFEGAEIDSVEGIIAEAGPIEKTIEYATPWAELAESYIRHETGDASDKPFDWLTGVSTAVAGNLVTASQSLLDGHFTEAQKESFNYRLSAATLNTTINMFTAGVMAAFDKDKAQSYLINSFGGEVGQLVGGVLTIDTGMKKGFKDFTENQLKRLNEERISREEQTSASAETQIVTASARLGQSQQAAAQNSGSVVSEVAAGVSTADMPPQKLESMVPEPQAPTVVNQDGEQVSVDFTTVDTKDGSVLPWTYAKQLADAHAQDTRGEPATAAEINRQYRLLVQLNGDEVDFNRPFSNGTVLKSVPFDSNVEVLSDTESFVVAQDSDYRRRLDGQNTKEELEQIIIDLGSETDLFFEETSNAEYTSDAEQIEKLIKLNEHEGMLNDEQLNILVDTLQKLADGKLDSPEKGFLQSISDSPYAITGRAKKNHMRNGFDWLFETWGKSRPGPGRGDRTNASARNALLDEALDENRPAGVPEQFIGFNDKLAFEDRVAALVKNIGGRADPIQYLDLVKQLGDGNDVLDISSALYVSEYNAFENLKNADGLANDVYRLGKDMSDNAFNLDSYTEMDFMMMGLSSGYDYGGSSFGGRNPLIEKVGGELVAMTAEDFNFAFDDMAPKSIRDSAMNSLIFEGVTMAIGPALKGASLVVKGIRKGHKVYKTVKSVTKAVDRAEDVVDLSSDATRLKKLKSLRASNIDELNDAKRAASVSEGANRAREVATDTIRVPAGVGREAWVSPDDLRFSQRTISENNYRDVMESGGWKWSQDNPLIVIERSDGTLVSLDNRRLSAARQALNVDQVPIRILQESDQYLDYKTWRTAKEAFDWRANHPKTLENGGVIPDSGLSDLPHVLPKSR